MFIIKFIFNLFNYKRGYKIKRMNVKKLKRHKTISTLLAYMELIRVKNCIIVFFAVLIGASIVLANISIPAKVVLAGLSGFIITAAGNIFNDYYDYVIDKINRPDRPIPSGKVKRSDAMMLSLILFLIGIAVAYNINKLCFAIASINVIILIIYARYSKKMLLVSNFIISYLVASIFLFGAFSASADIAFSKPIFILAGCAFLMTFSREIIKDIEDIKGDKEAGAETLPICMGAEKSKNVAVIFSVFAVLLSFVPLVLIKNLLHYLILIIIADTIFIYSLTKPANDSQKLMVAGMVLALVAFFIGSVF